MGDVFDMRGELEVNHHAVGVVAAALNVHVGSRGHGSGGRRWEWREEVGVEGRTLRTGEKRGADRRVGQGRGAGMR